MGIGAAAIARGGGCAAKFGAGTGFCALRSSFLSTGFAWAFSPGEIAGLDVAGGGAD
jgi:hypothetical protein